MINEPKQTDNTISQESSQISSRGTVATDNYEKQKHSRRRKIDSKK